ncbi:TPA: DNA helicase, partial [Streptococcus suis]
KKSLHFLYKPRFIEQYAKELFENLPETRENSQTLVPLIEELKEIVHPKFKLIKYLEKGIVYLHGRLPTNIRNYLLKYVREDLGVKHFIANSVVLAGMNLPIDSLFYISGFSNLNDLYNLIGRVNRLNEIFGNQGSIDRILIPIYFVEMKKYPQNGKSPLQNKVLSLRNELKDEVKNPLLEESKISESNRETSYEIIELENEVINNFHNPDFISRLTRAGAQQVLNYSVDGLKILEDVIENYYETANYQNIYLDILHKIKEIFFDPFVNQSNDKAIFYKYFKPTNNVKRLRFDSTIRYYAGFIQSSYSDLRIRIENQVRYWNRIVEKNKLNQEEVEYLQYIGAQFGDKAYNSSDYNDSSAKVYVDIRDYIERIDDLYNLAIIKLQVDDDFVDYEINLLVNTLKEFGIISEEQFNLFVFGTIENTELKILQLGINKALYLKLKRDNQISNIIFDEYKNPKANRELKSYIELKSGIEKFELEQFFL